jgi:hypothetical protein
MARKTEEQQRETELKLKAQKCNVFNEIISTEREYVNSLQLVIEVICVKWYTQTNLTSGVFIANQREKYSHRRRNHRVILNSRRNL